MKEWAKREVELACEREKYECRTESDHNLAEYTCACYESALESFNVLCDQGHSITSIQVTKNILNRLIDGKVLTPIDDVDDIWDEIQVNNGYFKYQCIRMPSLFKTIKKDGTILYYDVNRVVCIDFGGNCGEYYNGYISNIIDEMYPITMPYYPLNTPFKVYTRDFLYDSKNGDFDTLALLSGVTPDGEKFEIKRYFKECDDKWVEISYIEYISRVNQSLKNKKEETK
jgi:hypothetical protein